MISFLEWSLADRAGEFVPDESLGRAVWHCLNGRCLSLMARHFHSWACTRKKHYDKETWQLDGIAAKFRSNFSVHQQGNGRISCMWQWMTIFSFWKVCTRSGSAFWEPNIGVKKKKNTKPVERYVQYCAIKKKNTIIYSCISTMEVWRHRWESSCDSFGEERNEVGYKGGTNCFFFFYISGLK